MNIVAILGVIVGGFLLVPRDLLVIGILWLVAQFSPSLASTLFIGALMMWQ